MTAEARLKELQLDLGNVSSPMANYVNAVRTGNLPFLAGKGPRAVDGKRPKGKLGREYTVVKVLGMVNAVPEFEDHPKVINGCSGLLVEVFGSLGRYARSAVGMGSLPMGISVEDRVHRRSRLGR